MHDKQPETGFPQYPAPQEPDAFPHIGSVARYWSQLRGHSGIPERAALDPRAIAPALGCVFIAELVTARVARLRIAGDRLHDLMGMDVRGMPLTVFFVEEARDEVLRAIAHVAGGGRAQLPLCAEVGLARPALEARLALMPLRGTGGGLNRLLGVLETHGPVGHAPRRFMIKRQATPPPAARPPDAMALPHPHEPLADAIRRRAAEVSPTPAQRSDTGAHAVHRASAGGTAHERPHGGSASARTRAAELGLRVIAGGVHR